jgi:hypothetical protein
MRVRQPMQQVEAHSRLPDVFEEIEALREPVVDGTMIFIRGYNASFLARLSMSQRNSIRSIGSCEASGGLFHGIGCRRSVQG